MSGSPPTVTKVEVGSTSWSSAFVQFLKDNNLGTDGYSIPIGSTAQSSTVTFDNVDQILVTFSGDVQVDAADLSLSGVNQTAYSFRAFHYDPQTHVAIWTLAVPLDKERIRLDLDASGMNPVRSLDGTLLDGEWVDNVSTVSGDGTPGGNFAFNFNVLPTDVNNTGSITAYDYAYIVQLNGKTTTSAGYLATRDVNGDGVINSSDWQEARDRAFQALPSGSPAGTNNHAPTTSGFDLVEINDSDTDVAVSLLYGFDDAESGSSGLTYSIVSNDNAALFDTATVNPSTDKLTFNAASGASGRAVVTVRATDPGGLFVDTTVTVDVNRTNQPPSISNLDFVDAGANTWIVSGDVTDPDDDVSQFIVQFYGVFSDRSAVDENGHFEFAVILDESQVGVEYAVTSDPHGLQSNVPFGEIGMT